MLKIYFESV